MYCSGLYWLLFCKTTWQSVQLYINLQRKYARPYRNISKYGTSRLHCNYIHQLYSYKSNEVRYTAAKCRSLFTFLMPCSTGSKCHTKSDLTNVAKECREIDIFSKWKRQIATFITCNMVDGMRVCDFKVITSLVELYTRLGVGEQDSKVMTDWQCFSASEQFEIWSRQHQVKVADLSGCAYMACDISVTSHQLMYVIHTSTEV